jgi:hypothetical protein
MMFILTIIICSYIPPALSGAINPTLSKVSERVDGKIPYLRLAGSGGYATIKDANDCGSSDGTCPAKGYYADHYQSLQFALEQSR